MRMTRLSLILGNAVLLATLAACGGGSDGGSDGPSPTGGALANLWFADSEGYHPLDKVRADGSFYNGGEADFGPVNPAYTGEGGTQSRWAIDTSATAPAGETLTYSFKLEGATASVGAVASLLANLRINSSTGLITQTCSGFPECYDNVSGKDEDFLVSVTAQASGGGTLERSFLLRVRGNR
jgi:hypothetical protein